MIPMAVPNLCGNEKKYLDNCIDTTFVSSVGEYVNRFEEMVADATDSKAAVATSSGTTGLHAALTAVGVKYEDLVIIPSFTFIATANAVRHCGANPWLMEIRESDWCMDAELVRAEIERNCERNSQGDLVHKSTNQRIAALMPVYTLGNIPDMDAYKSIADEYGLPMIADAACAIGAKYKGRDLGALAAMSVLSFNGNKTVTCGGGGAVVGDIQDMINHVRHLTTTARVWPDYDFDEAGFNYRMTNIQAAVGVAQMEKMPVFVNTKRKIREFYSKDFSDLITNGYGVFPMTAGASCWFSGIVMPQGSTLDDTKRVCAQLKDEGVDARPFWKPIHLQKPYENCPKAELKYTDSLWQRILTLPCSTGITDNELTTVGEVVKKVLG